MTLPPPPPDISSLFSLHGRIALITGASRGLGFTMARALASAGARVVLAAFGGLRDSGLGRERGREAVRAYMQQKSLYWGLNAEPIAWARS